MGGKEKNDPTHRQPHDGGSFYKFFKGKPGNIGNAPKLDIGYETFSAFNALNGIFVNIKSGNLELIGKGALRKFFPRAPGGNNFSAKIVFSVCGFVNEHKKISCMTHTACQNQENYML